MAKKRKTTGGSAPSPVPLKKQYQPSPLSTTHTLPTPAATDDEELVGGLVYNDELDTTLETLRTISQNPELLKSKQLKPLKAGVYEMFRVMNEENSVGASSTSSDYYDLSC